MREKEVDTMDPKIKQRCEWAEGDPLMEHYHDTEWGFPAKDDNELFERLTLQIFQAGLSWKIILNRRKAFRKAFSNFNVKEVADYGPTEMERLLTDKNIIRNKLKIQSTIDNAKRILKLQKKYGSFQNFLEQLPNELSVLQNELKRTFKFIGPEIARMFVMSIGKIEVPHDHYCWRYKE
ncbi:MAG: DNA-3-methyladenine glycosylase I [Candidatus Heimdallarchaeota archaeon]